MKAELYHLQINVKDTKVSFPFYKELFSYLEYKVSQEGSDYIGFTNAANDLWLIGTESKYLNNKFHRKNTGLNHIAFKVDSREKVDEFYNDFLIKNKIAALYDSPKLFPEYSKDYYAVYFEDPDKIKIEVVFRSFKDEEKDVEKNKENNLAFIDGQNLHLGTTASGWRVDLRRFKVYLKDKYKVTEAYYFLGYRLEKQKELYDNLDKAGFVLIFKEHDSAMLSTKRGNVDTDIVFEIMNNILENKDFNKVIIVSGDGDYKKIVNFLIKKDKFEKILFPNKKFSSSLFKYLGTEFFDYLENIKSNIMWSINEKGS